MVFNSSIFLIFLLIFLPLYAIVGRYGSVNIRNLLVMVASYVFYGWWDYRFLSLIFISSLSDFILGRLIFNEERRTRRTFLFILSLVINLGMLGFFKYYNFFIDSLRLIIPAMEGNPSFSTLNVILPVGISFYTFQTMSYTIDIYRRRLTPTRDILAFFAFVSFFPQLVAGPIERAANLLVQFRNKHRVDAQGLIEGGRMVLWGLFKKVVIADNVGLVVDQLFLRGTSASLAETVIGAILFGIQIYCDFSGYSDMAIGLARILGFRLMMNFRTPYLSASFTDFWRRWHISLSSWFRDYVYIPLGGSRRGRARESLNLMITFLLSGLWHGANFNFLLWGALHGSALTIEKNVRARLPQGVKAALVFLITSIFWLPFRVEGLPHLMEMITSVRSSHLSLDLLRNALSSVHAADKLLFLLPAFTVFVMLELKVGVSDFQTWLSGRRQWFRIGLYYLLVIAILLLGNFNVKPYFIYFQF